MPKPFKTLRNLLAAGMVAGLMYNFPGSVGIDNSTVLVLLGIDTMREPIIELPGYDTT